MTHLKETYNVGIVGCGYIAQTHLKVLKKVDGLKVVAVCDSDEKKAAATSRKWSLNNSYGDFLKMLSNEDISILSILTPPASHAYLAIEAIRRGINVLIEKPLTMTTAEADPIIKALEGSKAKMTVVYHWLFSKAMLKSLSLIREGKIGEVLNVKVEALHAWWQDPMTRDPNHWSHKLPGGRFGEMLPHPVYILQAILGDSLQTLNISALKRGTIEWMLNDELQVILRSDECIGLIYVSFNAPRESTNVTIYGTKGILRIDLTQQTLLRLGPRNVGKLSVAMDSLSIDFRMLFSTIKNALEYSFSEHGQPSISNVYNMFRESISQTTEPPVTAKMAYNTVRIVEEICDGMRSSGSEIATKDYKKTEEHR